MPKGVHRYPQHSVRLPEWTWALLGYIAERREYRGRSEAIQFAARRTARALGIPLPALPKSNSRKKSGKSREGT